jgi:hypothetical protein
LIPLLLAANILVSLIYFPLGLSGFADFRQLYTGGYMIRTGLAHEIYDYDKQQETEEALVPMRSGLHFLLPITHLAFEEVLFAPLSIFSYRVAFCIFLVVNLGLTGFCVVLLQQMAACLRRRWRWFVPFLVVGFFPIWRALLQGQDSVLLLSLLLVALLLLNRSCPIGAGMVMGIALFKFNVVVPIALLFLAWKQWAFFCGFVSSSVATVGASFVIVGSRGIHDYIGTLSAMSVKLGSAENVIRYATISTEMVNLRGLISALLQGHVSGAWVQRAIFLVSAVVLLLCVRRRPSFALAIVVAALVSYNFVAHDATILIIPIVSALAAGRTLLAVLAIATWVFPFTAIVPRYGFIGSIPALALFLVYLSGNKHMEEQFATALGEL